MGFLEDLFGTSTGVVTGGILIGTGVGLTMLTGNIEDKRLKLVPQVGGLLLAGVGTWKIYSSVVNPSEIVKSGDNIGIVLAHPVSGEHPFQSLRFNYGAKVTNSTERKKLMYVECTIFRADNLIALHLPVKTAVLNAGQETEVLFPYELPGAPTELGVLYGIEFSIWDRVPTEIDRETANHPNRLFETGWMSFVTG
jgi:hypothetical protein